MDVNALINAVKERPVLYDKQNKDYANKIIKSRLWREVYSEVYAEWDTLSEEEKKVKGKFSISYTIIIFFYSHMYAIV
jgi:hypothetical protein